VVGAATGAGHAGPQRRWDVDFHLRAQQICTVGASGRLIAISDPNGYRTPVSYPAGSSMVVTNPAGRSLTFTLTGSHVTSMHGSASRSLSYWYDSAGNLTMSSIWAAGTGNSL
jgi:uncharacterized protein RhaS with RHS repeats